VKLPLSLSDAKRLAALAPDQLAEWLGKCRAQDVLLMDAAFELWAQQGQLPPQSEGWRVWLMMAGRGFGKTRAGAEWVHGLAMTGRKRIALVAASIDEARAVMVEGLSGLLAIARRRRIPVTWEPSLGRLKWPMGSVAQLFSGDNADGLRGPEHHFAWADELAKWRQAEAAWDNLQFGLRAGARPRALVTTTPRPMRLLERIRADKWTITTGGRTKDNVSLPKNFVEVMIATYGGSRIGRQELDGELMSEAEGSLFPRAMMEKARVESPLHHLSDGSPPPMGEELFDRIVVGVDPPASSEGDACGIVVAGRRDGKLYVLADCSVEGASPERWAAAVALAAAEWGASHVVAEANQGGAMVRSVLNAADAGLRVRLVHASRGKAARAEPVAIRFETGRAFLAGTFPELEAEMSGLKIGGDYDGPSRSPDRADACVWALTELSETRSGVPRVRAL
jgi:phage terminase large subunit-like protein